MRDYSTKQCYKHRILPQLFRVDYKYGCASIVSIATLNVSTIGSLLAIGNFNDNAFIQLLCSISLVKKMGTKICKLITYLLDKIYIYQCVCYLFFHAKEYVLCIGKLEQNITFPLQPLQDCMK